MIIQTIILGIVEGLTEFIPVSSTAHILLTAKMLGGDITTTIPALAIAIQSGAILAVIWYFWKDIIRDISLIPKVAIAFVPTAIVGITLYPIIKTLFDAPLVIAFALIGGGIALIVIRPNDTPPTQPITYKEAFLIGCAQVCSFIPGVSRAGGTLIGGTLLGINRAHIVRFSFLLGIPTILGASVVALNDTPISQSEIGLIVLGIVVSFVTARLTIKWFITLLSTKPLAWFGWYRILVGVAIALFFI